MKKEFRNTKYTCNNKTDSLRILNNGSSGNYMTNTISLLLDIISVVWPIISTMINDYIKKIEYWSYLQINSTLTLIYNMQKLAQLTGISQNLEAVALQFH